MPVSAQDAARSLMAWLTTKTDPVGMAAIRERAVEMLRQLPIMRSE